MTKCEILNACAGPQPQTDTHTHLALLSRHRYSLGSAILALVFFTPLSIKSPAWKKRKSCLKTLEINQRCSTGYKTGHVKQTAENVN